MRRRRIVMTAGILTVGALAAYLATGWIAVAPGELAVVRRFGRPLSGPWGPGLHWALPAGIDRVDRVRVDEVRRLEVGLAGLPGPQDDPGAGEFLTGDLNLLRARAVVQYRVSAPSSFAFRSGDVSALLTRLAESSLARSLAGRRIDDALRAGRAAVARDAAIDLGRAAARLGLGVAILGVSLTDAQPPVEVQADFAAAQAARSDRDRRLNEARAYQATSIPAARSEARSRLDRAAAIADRTVAMARARADRFLDLLAGSRSDRVLTVRRIFRDAIRDLVAGVGRKLVLTPEEPVDLSLFGAEDRKDRP